MAGKLRKRSRPKRYLLTAVALSTGTLMSGCGSQQGDEEPAPEPDGVEEVEHVEPIPMPANPKGAVYDEGVFPEVPEPVAPDPEGVEPTEEPVADPQPTPDVEPESDESGPPEPRPVPVRPEPPRSLPMPANPKGAVYDHGAFPQPTPSE